MAILLIAEQQLPETSATSAAHYRPIFSALRQPKRSDRRQPGVAMWRRQPARQYDRMTVTAATRRADDIAITGILEKTGEPQGIHAAREDRHGRRSGWIDPWLSFRHQVKY